MSESQDELIKIIRLAKAAYDSGEAIACLEYLEQYCTGLKTMGLEIPKPLARKLQKFMGEVKEWTNVTDS